MTLGRTQHRRERLADSAHLSTPHIAHNRGYDGRLTEAERIAAAMAPERKPPEVKPVTLRKFTGMSRSPRLERVGNKAFHM